jgi:AraC-like DNA-binding protein
MVLQDKAIAVGRMQKFIMAHMGDEITLDSIAEAVGYSKFHAARIFKELTSRTPLEYIRGLRLPRSAQNLQNSDDKVVNIAIDGGFYSHDGFTRAFSRQFGITPRKYRAELPPINWFIHHPI